MPPGSPVSATPPGANGASLILFVGGPQYSRFAANIAAPPPKKFPLRGREAARYAPLGLRLRGCTCNASCGATGDSGGRKARKRNRMPEAAGRRPSPPQAHRASPQLLEARWSRRGRTKFVAQTAGGSKTPRAGQRSTSPARAPAGPTAVGGTRAPRQAEPPSGGVARSSPAVGLRVTAQTCAPAPSYRSCASKRRAEAGGRAQRALTGPARPHLRHDSPSPVERASRRPQL